MIPLHIWPREAQLSCMMLLWSSGCVSFVLFVWDVAAGTFSLRSRCWLVRYPVSLTWVVRQPAHQVMNYRPKAATGPSAGGEARRVALAPLGCGFALVWRSRSNRIFPLRSMLLLLVLRRRGFFIIFFLGRLKTKRKKKKNGVSNRLCW